MDNRELRGPTRPNHRSGWGSFELSYGLRSRIGDNESPGRAKPATVAKKEQNQHGKRDRLWQRGDGERPEINCLSAGTERGQWTHRTQPCVFFVS